MSGIATFLTATGAAFGAVSAATMLHREYIRRPRLKIEHLASYMAPHGPDALVYQINMRLSAWHKDIYIHDIYLANLGPPIVGRDTFKDYDPEEILRFDIQTLLPIIRETMLVHLDLEDYVDRLNQVEDKTLTQDLKIPAGAIMTVTASELICRPGVLNKVRKGGWWLVIDFGVGREEQKVFTDY